MSWTRKIRHSKKSRRLVWLFHPIIMTANLFYRTDAKAKAELAAKAKGSKGPLNTGAQGIKKSGKK